MTDLTSIVKRLGNGLSEKGEKTTQEIEQLTESISQIYEKVKPSLNLNERLALQRLAMDSDRYVTALVVNKDTIAYLTRDELETGSNNDFWLPTLLLNAIYHSLIRAGISINIQEKGKDAEYHAHTASGFIKMALKLALEMFQKREITYYNYQWVIGHIGKLLEKYGAASLSAIPRYDLGNDLDFMRVYLSAQARLRESGPTH